MTISLKSAGTAALAFCLTFGVVGVLAEPAAAARPGTPDMVSVSEEVSTAGLDLTKASDRQRLESRIRSATRRVCGDNGLVGMVKDERLCRKAAQVSAQRQVASLLDRSQRLANAAGQPIEIRTSVAVAAPSDD